MKNVEMANLFSEATPYIQKYHGKTMVVKYGGNAMINEELKSAVMNDLVTLCLLGVRVCLVHGGGPAINEMLEKIGHESKFINGLRYTDEVTIKVVQQVLAGQVNKDLVARLKGKGVCLCGIDGQMMHCTKKITNDGTDLGYVGFIEQVDTDLINDLMDKGYIPVIASVGLGDDGTAYNLNADTAAAEIAIALQAEKFVSMTDIAGILMDKNDESTLINSIEIGKVPELMEKGIIAGGMIPKVKGMVNAINQGVHEVSIIDGRVLHSVLLENFSDQGSGTLLYKKAE